MAQDRCKKASKRLPLSTDIEITLREDDEDNYDFTAAAEPPPQANPNQPTKLESMIADDDEPVDVTPESEEAPI